MLRLLMQKLLGGRPMLSVDKYFVDVVAHKPVFRFIDCFGRMWMANTRWSFFRQRIGQDWEEEKKRREERERFLNSEGRSGSLLGLD